MLLKSVKDRFGINDAFAMPSRNIHNTFGVHNTLARCRYSSDQRYLTHSPNRGCFAYLNTKIFLSYQPSSLHLQLQKSQSLTNLASNSTKIFFAIEDFSPEIVKSGTEDLVRIFTLPVNLSPLYSFYRPGASHTKILPVCLQENFLAQNGE